MIYCPKCGSTQITQRTLSARDPFWTCAHCGHGWIELSKETEVSDIVLPKKGRWIRITERMPNQVTKIHEGPVHYVRPPDDHRKDNLVSLGRDSWRYSVSIGGDDGHGPTIWKYIAPPEPGENGACWVIPGTDGYVVIWQRRDSHANFKINRWFTNGNGSGLPWTAIVDVERGYLLEVKRDS